MQNSRIDCSHVTSKGMQFRTNRALIQSLKLEESGNVWKPKRKLDLRSLSDTELKTNLINRATRAISNKLTPDNSLILAVQMAQLDIDTDERVGDVIDIVFEKACLEPMYAEAYANLCKTVLSIRARLQEQEQAAAKMSAGDDSEKSSIPVDPVVTLFRRQLLNRCQQEFQREKDYQKEYEDRKSVIEKLAISEEEKKEQLEILKMDVSRQKKKSLGNLRFIGELFKLDFLTERIMHVCIESLLKKTKDEDSLECMCQLLITIGRKMDHETGRNLMDQYFKRMQNIVDRKLTSSRIRFMLQDVIDLRDNKWRSKKAATGPRTISEIHKEAREEDMMVKLKAAELKERQKKERQQNPSDSNDFKLTSRYTPDMSSGNTNKPAASNGSADTQGGSIEQTSQQNNGNPELTNDVE